MNPLPAKALEIGAYNKGQRTAPLQCASASVDADRAKSGLDNGWRLAIRVDIQILQVFGIQSSRQVSSFRTQLRRGSSTLHGIHQSGLILQSNSDLPVRLSQERTHSFGIFDTALPSIPALCEGQNTRWCLA